MAAPDYYAKLGVARDATREEIGRAFRRLAAKYHPDRNPGDKAAEEKFKKIADAYQVLNDPKARAAYDRGGEEQVRVDTGFEGFRSTEDIFSHFGDIFGELLGERIRRTAGPERGEDFETTLEITPEEAARGGARELTVDTPAACETCAGTGWYGGLATRCPSCRGTGFISQRARSRGGFFSMSTPCATCGGTGIEPDRACPRCQGRGAEARARTVEVSVPPGVENGTVLRLRGLGGPGLRGGPPGDLRVRIRVGAGLDLRREVMVDLATAVLGGTVEVPLEGGTVEMTLPPGTQPGQQFRLAGQGRRDARGARGDARVTVQVEIPRHLTEEERRLFERLRRPVGARR